MSTVLIGIVYPLSSLLWVGTSAHRNDGYSSHRISSYLRTIFVSLILVIIVAANFYAGFIPQPESHQGLNPAAIVFSLLIAAYIIVQFRQRLNTEEAAVIQKQMKEIWPQLPKSDKEKHWFVMKSAGMAVAEELSFRFFLFHSLSGMGVPAPAAILILNIAFALSHAGSGRKNMMSSFLLGIVFSVIYYFSGYILLPVVLHAAIEIHAGATGYRVYRLLENK